MAIDYDEMLTIAIDRIDSMPRGTVFFAKDLFDTVKWKALERGDKLGYGRFFKNKVLLSQVEGVIYVGKADNNSAQYKKQ